MARVLVTGMSGSGKTTVLDELRRRGPEVVVSGTVDNQGCFYDRFEHVVLLGAPLQVPVERVRIARHLDDVEPLLRRGASVELDGRRPVPELADVLEELLTGGSKAPRTHITGREPPAAELTPR